MVMSSAQIAQANASFQQQSMMSMQHSGMLSQNAGQGAGTMAQGIAGSTINTTAAVAGPLAMGGMMLAGVDPISRGFTGAMSGGARAGMMGAVGGGLAGAALPMAGMMAAQYAGGQMMTGMQEQQQLRGQLGQGFQHMNAYGGRGFTREESSQIGGQFRQMTEERGPGGEFTTMDELGRLAANMGRMGMAQGVKNAKDFNEKFKKMMTAVKDIAQEFSTSLEEAQKIMGSMRGAGVFGQGSQVAMAKGMRQGAVGAGVSMDEMAQMANVGSQISRAIGGRGRSGAVAGVKALSTVGGAIESGALSEEDIYNATGLTGAAGKQAMASNMVQRDAGFIRKGRGRQLLAAIALKDGGIDMAAVRKIQAGEMSVAETIKMRKGHLNTMSRANFIRNEGRLRGEALAAFGGMASSSAHMGWLKGKGYDPASMDDKALLAFQRHTGMDRDEADAEMKIIRNMDNIMDTRNDRMREDEIVRSVSQRNKKIGIEGVKRKLESAKAEVNNTLRQAGADILGAAEDRLESFINSITGEYVRKVALGTAEGVRLAKEGAGGSRVGQLTGFDGGKVDAAGIEKAFGGDIAYGGAHMGVPGGDLEFSSEGARQRGLSSYLFGGGEKEETGMTAAGAMGVGFGAIAGPLGAGIGGGAALGKAAADFFGIGGLSEGERKSGAAFMEEKGTLAASRGILGARTPEEQAAAADSAKATLKRMEEDGANDGSIAAQKQITALARIRAGESKQRVLEQTGLTEEDIERTEGAMRATLGADRLLRQRQTTDEMMKDIQGQQVDVGMLGLGKAEAEAALRSGKTLYGDDGEVLSKERVKRNLEWGMPIHSKKISKEDREAYGKGKAYRDEVKGIATKYNTLKAKDAEDFELTEEETEGKSPEEISKMKSQKKDAAIRDQGRKLLTLDKERRAEIEGYSEDQLQRIVDRGGRGAGAARRELAQDKILAKAKGPGGTLQALAQMFGGELSKEDAADLKGMKGDELVKGFTRATGAGLGKMEPKDLKELKSILTKAAAGGDIDKDLTGIEGGGLREGLRRGREKSQDVASQMNDPSFRKLSSMDTHMGNMVKIMGSVNEHTRKAAEEVSKGKEEAG